MEKIKISKQRILVATLTLCMLFTLFAPAANVNAASKRTKALAAYQKKLKKLDSKIETVFLLSKPEYCHISSSLVRQLMDINIGIEDLVPNAENGIFKRMND